MIENKILKPQAVGYENLYGIIGTITDVPNEVIKMGPAYLEPEFDRYFERNVPLGT